MILIVKQKLFIQIIFLLLGEIISQNIGLGPCPVVETQSNFDDNEFQGRWFEIACIPRLLEGFGKCIVYEYIPPENNIVTINRRRITILTNSEEFKSSQATVLKPGEAISEDDFIYRVVRTDYENYAVVYACKNNILNISHSEFLWILGRTPNLEIDSLDMAYTAIRENNLPGNRLIFTEQNDCPDPQTGNLSISS